MVGFLFILITLIGFTQYTCYTYFKLHKKCYFKKICAYQTLKKTVNSKFTNLLCIYIRGKKIYFVYIYIKIKDKSSCPDHDLVHCDWSVPSGV